MSRDSENVRSDEPIDLSALALTSAEEARLFERMRGALTSGSPSEPRWLWLSARGARRIALCAALTAGVHLLLIGLLPLEREQPAPLTRLVEQSLVLRRGPTAQAVYWASIWSTR